MTDEDVRRIERDVENLHLRIRTLENVEAPGQRRFVTDLVDLQHQVDRMEREGTTATAVEMRSVRATLARIEALMATKEELRFETGRVELLEEDAKTNRRSVRAALIAAALALGGGILLFVVERGLTK